MKLNDTGGGQGLFQDTRSLLGFSINDTGSYSDIDLLRNINVHYGEADNLIWKSSHSWEYDDKNQTDFPIATTNLVADQQDYELPTWCHTMMRVEILDADGDWYKIEQIDQSEVDYAMSEYYETAGKPTYYDVFGNSIFLYPKPSASDVTLASGLRVWFSRGIKEFAITETSTEPGFNNDFHRFLSAGAALDKALSLNMEDKQAYLQRMVDKYRQDIIEFHGDRNVANKKIRIIPSGEGVIGRY